MQLVNIGMGAYYWDCGALHSNGASWESRAYIVYTPGISFYIFFCILKHNIGNYIVNIYLKSLRILQKAAYRARLWIYQ